MPRDQLVVITGVSGSGNRPGLRYHLCRRAAALCRIPLRLRPAVSRADGKTGRREHPRPLAGDFHRAEDDLEDPRWTVGTVTRSTIMRLLFARIGRVHCPSCSKEIASQTVQQMVDRIMEFPEKTRLLLLAPIIRGRKGIPQGTQTAARRRFRPCAHRRRHGRIGGVRRWIRTRSTPSRSSSTGW